MTELFSWHAVIIFSRIIGARGIMRTNLQMCALMLCTGILNTFFGEKLTAANGFGWDGVQYASWARNLSGTVLSHQVSGYYIQRVLPSVIVHFMMRLAGISFTDHHVVLTFCLYEAIVLTISVYYWGLIADRLDVESSGKWLGFIFLFVNFNGLKNSFYAPVMTDPTAVAFGFALFYLFLARKPLWLLAVTFLGSFTWPTLLYHGLLLYVFPVEERSASSLTPGSPKVAPPSQPSAESPVPGQIADGATNWSKMLPGAIAFLVAVFIVFYYVRHASHPIPMGSLRFTGIALPVSVAITAAYLYFGLRPLIIPRLISIPYLRNAIAWPRVLAALALVVLVRIISKLLANHAASIFTLREMLIYSMLESVRAPAIFLVAHAVFFGPAILLAVVLWKEWCGRALSLGMGIQLLAIGYLAMSIDPQSRFLDPFIPILLAIAVKIVAPVDTRYLVSWLVLSLVYSKIWYPINYHPIDWVASQEVNFADFPAQGFYMNAGPWISARMYLIQALIVGLTLIWVRKSRQSIVYTNEK